MSSIFNSMLAEVKLSFRLSLVHGASAMQDHKIAQLFNIPLKIKRISQVQDIVWCPPPHVILLSLIVMAHQLGFILVGALVLLLEIPILHSWELYLVTLVMLHPLKLSSVPACLLLRRLWRWV